MSFDPYRQMPDERQKKLQTDYAYANEVKAGRKRHGCVEFWLGGMVIFGGLAALEFVSNFGLLSRVFTSFLIYSLLGVALTEIICAIAILRWKRWGVYGLGVAVSLSFCLRVVMGILRLQSILAVGFAFFMIYNFIRPNWEYYD